MLVVLTTFRTDKMKRMTFMTVTDRIASQMPVKSSVPTRFVDDVYILKATNC